MCDRRYKRSGAGSTITDSHHTSWHGRGSCAQQTRVSGGWRCVGSSPQCVCACVGVCVRVCMRPSRIGQFSFLLVCVRASELSLCLLASIPTTWFLAEQRWPPRWSPATRTRVDVLGQRAGNLNLHTPWLQLPDLLPQEPRLLLHALFPHPAEH